MKEEGIVFVQFSATRGRVASHKCDVKKEEGASMCIHMHRVVYFNGLPRGLEFAYWHL